MDIPVFFDAPGLAVLPAARSRPTRRRDGAARRASRSPRQRCCCSSASLRARVAVPVAAVAAGAILAWNAYGEISFAREAHKVASAQLDNMPRPLDWVDRAVPRRAGHLPRAVDRRSVRRAAARVLEPLGSSTSGARTARRPARADGRPAARVARRTARARLPASTTSSPTPASRPWGEFSSERFIAAAAALERGRSFASTPPLRLRQSIEGVYPDGWGSAGHGARPVLAWRTARRASSRCTSSGPGAAQRYPATVRVTVGSSRSRATTSR